ncbi:DinB family protein [Streptomyces sp. NPDC048142]|uniref:DinB family protein n=1 Tax=Streptomyces sp. NPDC048142 TaxID=3365501 RepID=UPI00371547B3
MTTSQPKAHLQHYLQSARDALLWKLDGLSEYDIRRPLTPTGTNLLGLVKHAAGVELGYFGETFRRPFGEAPPAYEDDAEANQDMWATPDESREDVLALYRRVAEHADATIAELPLDAVGQVRWWPGERGRVTLHQILIHVISDLQRHAGHADIVRELIDGTVGLRSGTDNMPPGDRAWWGDYRQRLEQAAREVGEVGEVGAQG